MPEIIAQLITLLVNIDLKVGVESIKHEYFWFMEKKISSQFLVIVAL